MPNMMSAKTIHVEKRIGVIEGCPIGHNESIIGSWNKTSIFPAKTFHKTPLQTQLYEIMKFLKFRCNWVVFIIFNSYVWWWFIWVFMTNHKITKNSHSVNSQWDSETSPIIRIEHQVLNRKFVAIMHTRRDYMLLKKVPRSSWSLYCSKDDCP